MRILIINPMPYTSETRDIHRVDSIKDTMIVDLCLAFCEAGHEVTLFAAQAFRPTRDEVYPFRIIWGKCFLPCVFWPHRFQVMPELWTYLRENRYDIDMIISSEVFSVSSLLAYRLAPQKLIIWHELAKHNALLKKIPSQIWYGFIVPAFMRNVHVVARSQEAQDFIKQYCRNVDNVIIDHGVNLSKFLAQEKKENHFVVCSQLVARKRIDGILRNFAEYLTKYDPEAKLYIIGDGEHRTALEALSTELKISENIVFTGKMRHEELIPILASAKALLVNTEKDNSMISIVESIAVGTPILTTKVPLNSTYIERYKLGITGDWTEEDIATISRDNEYYVGNCMKYRKSLSTEEKVNQFEKAYLKRMAGLEYK